MARIIPLQICIKKGGKYSRAVYKPCEQIALVSDDDFERVIALRWSFMRGYAITTIDGLNVSLHRFVLNGHLSAIPAYTIDESSKRHRMVVDHINRVPLDCRRSNLRIITHAENMKNQHKRRALYVTDYSERPRLTYVGPGSSVSANHVNLIWGLYLSDLPATPS